MPINSGLIFRDKLATIEHEVSLYSVTAKSPLRARQARAPRSALFLAVPVALNHC
jgi:hypothetical protein